MNILITGATGFTGRALSKRLNELGHHIVILSRNPEFVHKQLPWVNESYKWPASSEAFLNKEIEHIDAVIHLAGEPIFGLWTARKRRRILESRVNTTKHLVSMIEQFPQRPSVFISASSDGWYGDRGDDILMEDEPAGSDFLADVCVQWEREAIEAEKLGIKVVRLRSSSVLGSTGGFLKPQLFLYRLGLGGHLGSGLQWWSWIHQEDWIRMVIQLLVSPSSGIVNATAPNPIQQKQFARILSGLLGRPAFLRVPGWVVKSILGGLAQDVLGSRRVASGWVKETGFQFEFPTLDSALRSSLCNR
jgi:uncharacterized protein (TIGR01777 family)